VIVRVLIPFSAPSILIAVWTILARGPSVAGSVFVFMMYVFWLLFFDFDPEGARGDELCRGMTGNKKSIPGYGMLHGTLI
jgi:hypothetical protein